MEIAIRKGTRALGRVNCPTRSAGNEKEAFYRGGWWPVRDGSIDIAGSATPSVPVHDELAPDDIGTGVDLAQEAVIHADEAARMVVEAGPGTGKTWVACRRVAELVASGVPASRIWMISFTRTAVVEIRQRIAAALGDPADAVSVRIATLDSHAWSLQSGFSNDAALTGSFDENIAQTAATLAGDPDAADYLARLRHLVIDEAQDIVGVRQDLILAMIAAAGERCGVTVFTDEAQAIYDFTEDKHAGPTTGSSLAARLCELGFARTRLSRVHRTGCPKLRTIFTDVRDEVLDPTLLPASRAARVREEIVRLAHADAGDAGDFDMGKAGEDALLLFRRRAEVLERSSWAGDIPHRLRMSGLPQRIRPWLAALFWDWHAPRVSRDGFVALWRERITGAAAAGAPQPDEAWALLVEVAGESIESVGLSRVRDRLGRSAAPLVFCSPEYGDSGPVLGTIHASKGREANEVHLFLPPLDPNDEEPDQETRVIFVGATRARKRLLVGRSGGFHARSTSSQRVWRRGKKRGTARVEVGRAGDLDPVGLVGARSFADATDALAAQQRWLEQPLRSGLAAFSDAGLDWDYEIRDADGTRLGILDRQLNKDLWDIAKAMKAPRPPGMLPHLRSFGLASIVLRPDDPRLADLHEPWRSSGFLFVPMLTGFSSFRISK